ncbi:hypothetical protein [Saccharothrix lopnurensis]|uniref:Uncharacterized protein n=1 Tax=Saccharothrix lopnurensis TaxID=1670621 RepID=A0ABW1PFA3_9PSEU
MDGAVEVPARNGGAHVGWVAPWFPGGAPVTREEVGRVRAAGRTSRFGLLLTALLVLLGISAGVAPGAPSGHPGHPPVRVTGWSASSEPSMHDDRHDWLRLSAPARYAQAASHPDTWWVLCGRVTGRCALRGRPPLDEPRRTGTATAEPSPRSSRAPPAPRTG